MAKIYTELTDMLDVIQQDEAGEWIIDRENDGSPKHPIQMPYVSYSGIVEKFMDAVYTFDKSHPEYGLKRYGDILERNGIKWGSESMDAVDVADKENTKEKRCLTKKIKQIDTIINDKKLLEKEYIEINRKLPLEKKIFSMKVLAKKMEKERQDYVKKIEELNNILNPQKFSKYKKELQEKA